MPNPTTHTLVITAAYTGMRISKLFALTRDNLHLDIGAIHVSATVGALHEVAGHQLLGPPKTPAAVRDIARPPFLIDGLEQLLRTHPYDTAFCTGSCPICGASNLHRFHFLDSEAVVVRRARHTLPSDVAVTIPAHRQIVAEDRVRSVAEQILKGVRRPVCAIRTLLHLLGTKRRRLVYR
ncbi:hypothetical protein ACFY36_19440 [Actinoplanes sp. NPDC000266]